MLWRRVNQIFPVSRSALPTGQTRGKGFRGLTAASPLSPQEYPSPHYEPIPDP
jgi:hypothetical protein